jgi:hypothetical protein
MANIRITVASPLRECLLHCGLTCVRDFGPSNALSADVELLAGWARQAGPEAATLALRQLEELIAVVGESSIRQMAETLALMAKGGEESGPAAMQRALLALLNALRPALASIADQAPQQAGHALDGPSYFGASPA